MLLSWKGVTFCQMLVTLKSFFSFTWLCALIGGTFEAKRTLPDPPPFQLFAPGNEPLGISHIFFSFLPPKFYVLEKNNWTLVSVMQISWCKRHCDQEALRGGVMWAKRPPMSSRSFPAVERSHKPRKITMECTGMVGEDGLGGIRQIWNVNQEEQGVLIEQNI